MDDTNQRSGENDMASSDVLPPPTDECSRLVRAIGRKEAFALIESFHGRRIYIPMEVKDDNPLMGVISREAIDTLVANHAREQIEIPNARQWRIAIYRSRGMTHSKIAQILGCSERHVRRVLSNPMLRQK